MFTEKDLRELLDYTAPFPILSVYLNTEPSQGNADAYRLRLRNLLKKAKLPQDVKAVERYFNQEYNWSGRSVAVFSCAPAGFFRAYPLAVPTFDLVTIGDRPRVKLLADLLDHYGGYGVVLIDKQGARLFFFHLGELQEQEGILGEAVKHTKRGGASSFPGRRGGTAGMTRKEDQTIDRNMKEAADFAVHFFENNHVRRVLIGGTDDNISVFRNALPKAWQSLILGSFPISMTASHADVLARAMQVGQESERQRSSHLVENMVTMAAKGGNAVTGLRNTLAAINQSRVQTLVIRAGLHAKGFYCPNCDLMMLDAGSTCGSCGGKMEVAEDVVELAVNSTIRRGGVVEVVRADPGLDKAGGIGALLRY